MPFERKPRIGSAQRCWKTRASTPYDAPTESRFSAIALSGTAIERKATSTKPNASARTNASTYRPAVLAGGTASR